MTLISTLQHSIWSISLKLVGCVSQLFGVRVVEKSFLPSCVQIVERLVGLVLLQAVYKFAGSDATGYGFEQLNIAGAGHLDAPASRSLL